MVGGVLVVGGVIGVVAVGTVGKRVVVVDRAKLFFVGKAIFLN